LSVLEYLRTVAGHGTVMILKKHKDLYMRPNISKSDTSKVGELTLRRIFDLHLMSRGC